MRTRWVLWVRVPLPTVPPPPPKRPTPTRPLRPSPNDMWVLPPCGPARRRDGSRCLPCAEGGPGAGSMEEVGIVAEQSTHRYSHLASTKQANAKPHAAARARRGGRPFDLHRAAEGCSRRICGARARGAHRCSAPREAGRLAGTGSIRPGRRAPRRPGDRHDGVGVLAAGLAPAVVAMDHRTCEIAHRDCTSRAVC